MIKIFKEPLFHFIIIGMFLFIIYDLVHDQSGSRDSISINNSDINNLITKWEMQWKRPPTEEELENLIAQNIKEEIFYQEALKMSLDHNDEIIRRRLSQKMQFLSNDLAALKKPTESELRNYFQKNSKKYSTPYSYSFYQITLSPEKRKDNYSDALEILKQISMESFEEMKIKGDTLPFPYFFENINANELASSLGSQLPEALKTQEINKWLGPIPSGFGFHLVYITKKTAPQLLDFKLIKKELIRDFEYENQNNMNETIYQELKKKYSIEFNINSEDFEPEYVEYLQNKYTN